MDNKKRSELETQAVLSGAGGAAGLYGASQFLDPRETLYHGTSPSIAEKIRKEGLRPKKSRGVTEILEDRISERPYVYTTPSYTEAAYYGEQAEKIEETLKKYPNGKKMEEILGEARGKMNRLWSTPSEKPLKFRVPTWRKDIAEKIVENPELRGAGSFGDFIAKSRAQGVDFNTSEATAEFYKNLKSHRVFKDGLGLEFLASSPEYQKVNFNEILNYAKARPGKVALGAGLGLAGLGGLAYSGKKVRELTKQSSIRNIYESGFQKAGEEILAPKPETIDHEQLKRDIAKSLTGAMVGAGIAGAMEGRKAFSKGMLKSTAGRIMTAAATPVVTSKVTDRLLEQNDAEL